MKLLLAAVGRKMPRWVDEGYAEFSQRFPPHLELQLKTVATAKRQRGADLARLRQLEGEALLQASGDACRVALDENGRQWSTTDLARRLEDWQQLGRDVAFLVGGPDGHHETLLEACDARWSLGRLVLPHGLVRVILAEQLYRAVSINAGHPYHRA